MSEKRLTRYNLVNVSEDAKFKIDSCGDWVRYESVALMVKQLASVQAELEAERNNKLCGYRCTACGGGTPNCANALIDRAEAAERDADELGQELIDIRKERDNWEESARQFCNNMEYYRGQCDKALAYFGKDAYTSDDGTIQQDPLRAKLPELVAGVCKERDELREENERYRKALGLIISENSEIQHPCDPPVLGYYGKIAAEALEEN